MNFEQFSLGESINSGIKSAGYSVPTPIQQQALPLALQGRDILGLAQTGTGKTAAFILPILHRLNGMPQSRKVRALVVAPTRELAEQIHQATAVLGKHTSVRSTPIYGGVGKAPQLAALRRGPGIVIACPGRLLDHLDNGDIDLSSVEVLVLDEADTMCDMGFLPDVRRILSYLPAVRQNMFFSATMPPDIRALSGSILNNPAVVEVDPIAPAKTVSHALYPSPEGLKKQLLFALLEQTQTGRAIIFTRTKHRARMLARDLDKARYRVAVLQGNLSQNRRQEAMDGFRKGKYDFLVATDIAAHGIDVPEVTHVINFDMPDTVDAYTHRIGRTGRAQETGEAFTLAVEADAPMVREVEKVLAARIERRRLPGFDYGDFVPEAQFPSRPPEPARARPHPAAAGSQRRKPHHAGSAPFSARSGSRSGSAPGRGSAPGSGSSRRPSSRRRPGGTAPRTSR